MSDEVASLGSSSNAFGRGIVRGEVFGGMLVFAPVLGFASTL